MNAKTCLMIVLLGGLSACTRSASAIAPGATAAGSNDPNDRYTGRTVLFYESQHGNEIEYYDPNGRSYLWYPGNPHALAGSWRLDEQRLCVIYDSENIFNPATGETGRMWQCSSFEQHKEDIRDTQPGDIFHLSTEQVPFILPAHPGYRTLSEVK